MGNWELAIVLAAISLLGAVILRRLPKEAYQATKKIDYQGSDGWLIVGIEEVKFSGFRIKYWDEWTIGRNFEIYGTLVTSSENRYSDVKDWPEFHDIFKIFVRSIGRKFDSQFIGQLNTKPNENVWDCSLSIPFEVANNFSEELQRNLNQEITLHFKRVVGDHGSVSYPIVGFELAEILE